MENVNLSFLGQLRLPLFHSLQTFGRGFFPFDPLHDWSEGAGSYDTLYVINYILSKDYLSLNELNRLIQMAPYTRRDLHDKPKVLRETSIQKELLDQGKIAFISLLILLKFCIEFTIRKYLT